MLYSKVNKVITVPLFRFYRQNQLPHKGKEESEVSNFDFFLIPAFSCSMYNLSTLLSLVLFGYETGNYSDYKLNKKEIPLSPFIVACQ